MGLQATIDELLNYNRIDDCEASRGDRRRQREGIGLLPTVTSLAGAHGDDEAAAAGEDDPLLARPADQPDQRRASTGTRWRRRSTSTASTRWTASRSSSRASRKDRGDDDLPQHRQTARATRRTRTTRASSWSCSRWAWATSARRTCARRRGPSPAGRCHGSAAARDGKYFLKTPVFRPQRYDRGMKTVFGKTGNFGPDDIVDIVVDAARVGAVHRATPVHVSSSTRTRPTPTCSPSSTLTQSQSQSIRSRGRGDAALGRLLLTQGLSRAGEEPGRVHRRRHQGGQRPGSSCAN